ncbi:MAG TPA: hypothetical protein DDZ53_07215 [Firmicutes bacterium]|nr:hypothetical protein [Bacillota bacterium]
MKAYNEYMHKMSVSDTLHQRLVSCVADARPVRRPITIRRYAAAFACLAVVLISVFIMPRLTQHNVAPTQDVAFSKYAFVFNKGNAQRVKANIHIPGHFWQDLTAEELHAVFPDLRDRRTITATANFQSDDNGAALFNIDAHALSASGLRTYIQVAPDKVEVDYRLEGKTEVSDVLGTAVTAGYFETEPNSKGLRNVIYFATFKLSDVAYYVELSGTEVEKEALQNEISELIFLLIKGGVANLDVFHPVVPELRDDRLSLDEARADADFGAYLPVTLPNGFVFEDALRYINQEQDVLFVSWTKGMGYINWRVSLLEDHDKTRITSVADKKHYDLSLYPIPRADSVPDDLREIVDNPIFLSEELTLEVVQTRAYEISDAGDEPGHRMRFSVLYGDILVEISAKGVSPDAMVNILQQIKQ